MATGNWFPRKELSKIVRENRVLPFSDSDAKGLEVFSQVLQKAKAETSTRTTIYSSDYEMTGIRGHHALCKLLGVPFDDKIYNCGDNGIDLSWKGLPVQVKSTSYSIDWRFGELPHLIFFTYDKLDCDLYILLIIEKNRALIGGWMDKDGIKKYGKYRDGFKPDCYGRTDRVLIPLRLLYDSVWLDSAIAKMESKPKSERA